MEIKDHIIIIGHGYHGKNVSRTCAKSGIRYVVVDMDSAIQSQKSTSDYPFIAGDASYHSVLIQAGILEARALIVAISNINKIRSIIENARKYNPDIVIQIRKDIYNKYHRIQKHKKIFCTAVNCMDGHVQLPVINYLKKRFFADHVDLITEHGPNRILAELKSSIIADSIINRIHLSIQKHSSRGIAIVGHYDCTGNLSQKGEQLSHIQESIIFLKKRFPNFEIIGLWVDQNWQVFEINNANQRKNKN
jgi:Trk K+ transport system NAD-binding subunit